MTVAYERARTRELLDAVFRALDAPTVVDGKPVVPTRGYRQLQYLYALANNMLVEVNSRDERLRRRKR